MSRCLYLVSSSANREYVLDCLEALALPRGQVHHFRYRRKYVDESLWNMLPTRPERLRRRLDTLRIIVVYTFQEQRRGAWSPVSAHSTNSAYIPIRCGRLVGAFQDGDVAHFYFVVSEYIKRIVAGRSPREAIAHSHIRFRRAPGKNAPRSYAHLGADLHLAAPKSHDTRAFQDFVDYAYKPTEWRTRSLGSSPLDVTYDLVFFRVTGVFHERNGRLIEISPDLRATPAHPVAEYSVDSGETYHLGINTYLLAQLPAELAGQGTAQLKLEFDSTLFQAVGPTALRISSPYDLEYWAFQPHTSTERRATLTVMCDHSVPIDRDNFVRREVLSPQLSLQIVVRPSPGKR